MVPYHRIHLYLLVIIVVQVHSFRIPLPYGTGYQGTNHEIELRNQGIFHLLWKSVNYKPPKEPKVEGNVTARGYLSTRRQQLEHYIYLLQLLVFSFTR